MAALAVLNTKVCKDDGRRESVGETNLAQSLRRCLSNDYQLEQQQQRPDGRFMSEPNTLNES